MAFINQVKLPNNNVYNLKASAVPMSSVGNTSTSTAFVATVAEIAELADGVLVYLTNGVVNSASGYTLNINSLGAKPVYMSDGTASTTQFSNGKTVLFVYNSSRVTGGCWDYVIGYDSNTQSVTGVKGDSETNYRTGNVNITKANIGLGNVGDFKAVSTAANQGLSSTEQSNARANIGAGTSSLTLGTTHTTAAYGDHTHTTTIATDTGTADVTLNANTKYKLTAGGTSYVFTTPVDTTYSDATTSASGLMSATDKTKLDGIATGAEVNVQANWTETSSSSDAYIKNKPTLGTASAKDVPTSGDASATEVVMGNDSRLTDSRTPKSHTHGNITNDGTITSDTTIASGDKLVIVDATDNTVARSPITFDASTTTTALTPKGTFETFAKLSSPTFTGTPKAPTATAGTNTTQIATTAFVGTAVSNAISALPEPMVFKGSLGTGGTITALPVDGTASVGDTYKVITDGTYAGQAAKVGDTFICLTKTSSANTWELIPSGDEPSGTVTSITIKGTSPIAVSSESAITTSGTRTISHTTSGVTAGTYRSVTVDTYGHVTDGTNPTTLSGYGITDAKIDSSGITLGSNTIGSGSASSGGTNLSLVTTGEKYTWNNKSDLQIGTTSTTAMAGNTTFPTSIATSTGTSDVTLTAGGKFQLTAGGTSTIFTMPADTNTYTSAYCTTAAGTQAKTASCTDYTLTANTWLHILIKNANSYDGKITLNVNSKGAKDIWINGTVSSSLNKTLPAGTYIVYYDGTNYYFNTQGKLPGSITGDASSVNGHTVATDVPSGAVFTDTNTTYSFTVSNGLLTIAETTSTGGAALVDSTNLYISSTAPTGTIPDGSIGIGW